MEYITIEESYWIVCRGNLVYDWSVFDFLSDAFQWFVVTIVVPVLALALLAGVSLLFMWVVRKMGSGRKQSFEEWDQETRAQSGETQSEENK